MLARLERALCGLSLGERGLAADERRGNGLAGSGFDAERMRGDSLSDERRVP